MNVFVWFMLTATLGSVLLLIYAVANHNSERSFFLIFATICTFLYVFGYLLEIISPTLEAAFMGVRVQKMGTPFLVILNYLFIRDVYGEKRFSFRRHCLIFALPIFNLFTIQAFPLVRLHYTHIEYFWNGQLANCHGYAGPISYLATAYSFLFVFLNIRRILKNLRIGSQLQKRQSLSLLASILMPLVVNIYHTFSYNHLRIDLNPFAVSLSMALLLYSVRKQNLLNVVPLARAQVIESMGDAFIVYGKDFGFLDANKAAKNLFPELASLLPGEIIKDPQWLKNEGELYLPIDGEMRFYRVTQTHIVQNNKKNATCIVFHDITDKENELKSLYSKATFDPLMHIYNRATFFDLANFKLSSKKAKSYPYALLMIDLDHFKLVNDTYGHSCGDMVLQDIAAIIKGYFRQNDMVGRYGGEEIVVMLENLPVEKVLDIVERLRMDIENTIILYQGHEIRVTISIGIAYSQAGSAYSLDEMLSQADSALYKAKDNGRNCSRLCEER